MPWSGRAPLRCAPVSKIDRATGVAVNYPTGAGSRGIAFDGVNIWVTNFAANTVSKVDPATGSSVSFPVGNGPEGVAFDGTSIWVTGSASNNVTKLIP